MKYVVTFCADIQDVSILIEFITFFFTKVVIIIINIVTFPVAVVETNIDNNLLSIFCDLQFFSLNQ